MSEKQESCGNCKWWDQSYAKVDPSIGWQGQCRAHFPAIDPETGGAVWPVTYGADGCGCFKHRDDRAARLLQTKYMTRGEAA